MRIVNCIGILILLLFATVALAAGKSKTPNIYDEDHLAVTVTPQDTQFIIQLKSNPSTGYSWFLREYDDRFIQPVAYHIAAAKNKVVGAPQIAVWNFQVKKTAFVVPQQTVMRFVYARPWEGSDQTKQIVFRVNTVSATKPS